MKLNGLIRRLESLERQSEKEGYKGDAAEYAFRSHVLWLLSVKKVKRRPSAFNLFIARKCKGGKMSLQEAVKLWNRKHSR